MSWLTEHGCLVNTRFCTVPKYKGPGPLAHLRQVQHEEVLFFRFETGYRKVRVQERRLVDMAYGNDDGSKTIDHGHEPSTMEDGGSSMEEEDEGWDGMGWARR